MAEVIRLDDVLVQFEKKKKKSLQAVVRIHITYFQALCSGLSDAAATQFPHFPNLMQKQSQETESGNHDPDPRDGETSLSDIPRVFPSLVVGKKVTADKRSETNRSLPYK